MEEKTVHSDPEIMGGTPVFVSTRVPVSYLFDYLGAGETIEVFLDHYPTVSRQKVLATLKAAALMVSRDAHLA
ncbi:DUF433 domain-containing protein [Pseudoduganella sp. FT55W]|uniref:DUF433 domain-containing protein n=1 Tax=Duganella rivi TaxID=2666083 RepID=A0A7X4GVG8_9BURK|nr:DUF433 domain-containing protein [Duganella rivi]MYM69437.1 DUF433 domain-containing protein [Duganella rivi]